jgi:hypothetical protein
MKKGLFIILTLTVAVTCVFAQTWGPGTKAVGGETWLIDYKIVWEDTREEVDSGTLRWQEPRGTVTILDNWACERLDFTYNLQTGLPHPRKVGNRNQILIFMGFRKATFRGSK